MSTFSALYGNDNDFSSVVNGYIQRRDQLFGVLKGFYVPFPLNGKPAQFSITNDASNNMQVSFQNKSCGVTESFVLSNHFALLDNIEFDVNDFEEECKSFVTFISFIIDQQEAGSKHEVYLYSKMIDICSFISIMLCKLIIYKGHDAKSYDSIIKMCYIEIDNAQFTLSENSQIIPEISNESVKILPSEIN